MVAHMRSLRIEYATAHSIMCSGIRFFDSIVNPCLLRLPSQYVSFAFRIRSNNGRFGLAYSVVNRGWGLISRNQKVIWRDISFSMGAGPLAAEGMSSMKVVSQTSIPGP